jgi:alkanesulfonate monooxygenase SsuD/methylene tetrahydromethanopterin reductase-like flavin-dependent oxidoreductase (luciferase family)
MKKIGFLSFGHWTPSAQSQTRSAADALLQSIDLAVAAEALGADGAYFRVHHFARQLASPFPLLAAVGAKTSRIEIGTAVIDMRYENPLYMVEDAGAADLIAGGRLQLGISRGSPEQVIDGWRYFGYRPAEDQSGADMGRRHAEVFLDLLRGEGFAQPNPWPMFPNPPGLLRVEPLSEGLRDRIWWGAGSNATAVWAAKLGVNLQSSTLKDDETGQPFHVQQAAQIRAFRAAWKEAGHAREPRVLSAAASSRWSTIAIAPTSDAEARTRTKSASSTRRREPSSVVAMPLSRTSSLSRSGETRPSPRPTRCS